MKNIYDIITEQKALIDVKLTSYELEYVIGPLSESIDEQIIQEGFMDSVKNAIKKIIEFIKAVLRKIKDLIRKFLDLFRTKSKSAEDMEKQLQEINKAANNVGSSGAASAAAQGAANLAADKAKLDAKNKENQERLDRLEKELDEVKKTNEKLNKKAKQTKTTPDSEHTTKPKPKVVKSMGELIRSSNDEVRMPKYGDVHTRFNFFDKFLEVSETALDHIDHEETDQDKIMELPTDNFKRDLCGMLFKDPEANLIEKVKSSLGDGEEETFKVKDRADIIIGYINDGKNFMKLLQEADNELTAQFNLLIRMLESGEAVKNGLLPDDTREDVINHIGVMFKNAANTIATVVNYLTTSTAKAYNSYLSIGDKLLRDYKKAMGV